MHNSEIEQLEMDLLLQVIDQRYGFNFREYSKASLKRRVQHHLARQGMKHISELIPTIMHNEENFQKLLYDISVTFTELFRDPWFFLALREKVFPFLCTFPFINIWQAGCATGEETYSLAICLIEEGLYTRSRIYATDFNDLALEHAKNRIYPLHQMKQYSQQYLQAGGKESLSDYYISRYDSVILDPRLQVNVTFANHNLATDTVFGEMHLIVCRNVLIYFERGLQNRVIGIFRNSLRHNGFLCLGSKETLSFLDYADNFILLADKERIYQYKQEIVHKSPPRILRSAE